MRFKLTSGLSETDIQRAILEALGTEGFTSKPDKRGVVRRHGDGVFVGQHGTWWRANSGVLRGASGQPVRANPNGTADILGVCNGRFVAIEVKTEDGRQSKVQQSWQRRIEQAGGVYAVVRSVGEALAVIDALVPHGDAFEAVDRQGCQPQGQRILEAS